MHLCLAGSEGCRESMAFYDDTQFLTRPLDRQETLEIRPDTECWAGLEIHQDTGLLTAGISGTASKLLDDHQPTAMSCVGLAATKQRAPSRGLQMHACRPMPASVSSSLPAFEGEVSGESGGP